jgi:O-antigen ligase
MLKDFPLLGVGWGNFRYAFTFYKNVTPFPAYYEHLHNDNLQLVVETGLVGSFLYFLFLFKIFKDIFINLKKRHDPFVKGIVLGGLCGLMGTIFHGFFEYNFHIPAISLLFWFMSGLIYKCVHMHFQPYKTKEIDERENF